MTGRQRVLAALARQPVDRLPVWMMRQAGRYLPGYQALRQKYSFMEMASSVDLSLEISVEPVQAVDVDAAIVFHDILIPFELMGMRLDFIEGTGPVLEPAVRDAAGARRLVAPPMDESLTVVETLRRLRAAVGDTRAVFGFAGAPLTLGIYAIEGRSSKTREIFHRLLRTQRALVRDVVNRLAPVVADYLVQQARHADVLQIFESHADVLSAEDYADVAFPALRDVVESVRARCPGKPLILFGNGVKSVYHLVRELAFDGYSIETSIALPDAAAQLTRQGVVPALQGNFDPTDLLLPAADVRRRTAEYLLATAAGLGFPPGRGLPRGWIVNLGWGVMPPTDPASARAFVETVHAFTNAQP